MSDGTYKLPYLSLRVSTDHDEKSEFLTIDIILLSFSYKLNLTVEDGRQFTEACHDVGIWQKSVPEILHHFAKLFRDKGFPVPFNCLMPKRIQYISD